ncbi:hypothetical protein pipiens_011590 [Culex pipiens pipiens]|uniref:Uncharacterized protein n=1 Tax=Culex pipiens pipiens TaxID=38569 RepID=A0ABD1D748_CULPP
MKHFLIRTLAELGHKKRCWSRRRSSRASMQLAVDRISAGQTLEQTERRPVACGDQQCQSRRILLQLYQLAQQPLPKTLSAMLQFTLTFQVECPPTYYLVLFLDLVGQSAGPKREKNVRLNDSCVTSVT